ncbi:MAG TPA: hypothetical protein VEN81_06620 [Planctomycetota bacterium]|nr:hypothetical protein [Planctomycetota bacterium]
MPVYMFGGGGGPQAPFNRTFFNVTLGDILQRAPKEKTYKLHLYLVDGITLDVCAIDEMTDDYLTVRAYTGEEEGCDLTVNLIPYTLIYRIEFAPKESENSNRLGFRWSPPSRRGTAIRKPSK